MYINIRMRFILDANAIIYLIKSGLASLFIKLNNECDLVIDNNVYNEVVERGIENKYPDAYEAKNFLESNRIPIIPIDIKQNLFKFRDPGETSCYMLAKDEGICISSDIRANRKFKNNKIPFMELDTFFYNQFLKRNVSKKKLITILNELRIVNGTTANRISVFLEVISNGSEKDE